MPPGVYPEIDSYSDWLRANRPLAVNYIMGVAPLPRRFDRVKRIDFRGDHIRLTPFAGTVIEHPVDLSFI